MKKIVRSIFVLLLIALVTSCSSSKQVPYFQNIDQISLESSKGLYDAKIMPKDMLTITVITTDPKVAAPFNLSVQNTISSLGQLSTGAGSLQGYLVDNDGNINFPVIGKLHVLGLTKTQCQDLIRKKVAPYLAESENPVVTVTMASYRVTITGEVNKPGVVPVSTEKMSIVEALAQAGDLTIYGKRNNIMLIRENADGQKEAHRLNLNDANLINSPYYYLQQNDIIYVEPNRVRAQNSAIGSSTTIWFSFVGIVTSVASLLVNILRN
ncbi:polysaccharide biosynthesis/export family protein [Segatella baroniae]|uniref:Polysaccharide biosynthesis/export protein n=2 Tax=Segatella baroniae TaxID=305719 RepID=U2QD48_9BACT|nr:polysaccharide biosynthesis/export family protein [Segatella baroniae]ERK39248.1 polysaccharide biosynthesis/export protein [Segatella baroniae F0067]